MTSTFDPSTSASLHPSTPIHDSELPDLRRVYGESAQFSRAGVFLLVHLDGASVETIAARTLGFDPGDFFFDDCPLCESAKREGGHIVFDAESEPGPKAALAIGEPELDTVSHIKRVVYCYEPDDFDGYDWRLHDEALSMQRFRDELTARLYSVFPAAIVRVREADPRGNMALDVYGEHDDVAMDLVYDIVDGVHGQSERWLWVAPGTPATVQIYWDRAMLMWSLAPDAEEAYDVEASIASFVRMVEDVAQAACPYAAVEVLEGDPADTVVLDAEGEPVPHVWAEIKGAALSRYARGEWIVTRGE